MAASTSEGIATSLNHSRRGEHYKPLPTSLERSNVIAHATQTILADADALYRLWSQLEMIPRWQEYVVSVTPTSSSLSHWVMGDPEDPHGRRIEFDSEVTESVPGQSISWRSVTAGVKLSGTVRFHPTARGTRVALVQEFDIPGGWFTSSIVGAAKRSPDQIVKENLRHFKELAESGEIPTVANQPHGPRGVIGGIKEWMYGETNPTPPGTSNRV